MPIIDNLHQKVLEAASAKAALNMSKWHSACGTQHCRAGWMVHLAGDAGYALEQKTSTLFAALQIAKQSGHPISPARFFDSNTAALLDMKKMADAEFQRGDLA